MPYQRILTILKPHKKIFGASDLDSVLIECQCRDSLRKLQTPTVASYAPPSPAHSIRLDIFYLSVEAISTAPNIIIACSLTRFIVGRRFRNIRPAAVIDAVVGDWVMYFGRMEQNVADR